MKTSILLNCIIMMIVMLFVYTGFVKIIDFDQFRLQIRKSPLVADFAAFVAWSVPALEIIIAIVIAFSNRTLIGLYAAFFMMTSFTLYVLAIFIFSPYLPCSCGGIVESMSWKEHLFFNISFMILTVIAVLIYPDK